MHTVLASRFQPILQKRRGLTLGIWGEAGIGKSYQVAELLQGLSCRSISFHATTPLAIISQTLPKPKKLATWAERNLTRLSSNEAVESSTVIDALAATLASLAPFILHLEDIHEADQERTQFIQELAKVVSHIKGVGLIVTSRREPPEPFTNIKLEPLSGEEADRLLETDLKATLPKEALVWIYGKAAGNPLYTLEYLRYLTRQGFLWNDGKHWHWRKPEHHTMPVTVEALIEHLISQATTEPLQRYVLETRAFLPIGASDELWSKVARVSEEELQKAQTELSQQGIFKEREFAHPLFREVSLKTLSYERKQNLARQAIRVLEHEPAQAAYFVEDARLGREKTLEILQKAVAHVKERNKVEAAHLLAKAAAHAAGEEKSKLALEAATALQHQDIPKAVALVEHLLAEEPNNSEALCLAALLYARDMQEEKAEQLFARLPSHVRESKQSIETLFLLKRALYKHGDIRQLWHKYQHLQSSLDPLVVATVVYALTEQQQFSAAIDLATASLERPDLTVWQRSRLVNALGTTYYDSDRYETAEEMYSQVITLLTQHAAGQGLASAHNNRAQARERQEKYLAAREDSLQGYRLASETGNHLEVGRALSMLGILSVETGDYEGAEEYLNLSLALLGQRQAAPFLVGLESNFASLYETWVTPQSGILALKYAYASLRHALEVKNAEFTETGYINAALCEASFGSPLKALELAEQTKGTSLISYCALWAKARALKALNLNEEATALLYQAYEAAEQANHGLIKHKIGLELDRLNNDLESARGRMQWFEERGLMNGVNIAKRYFPELAEKKVATKPLEHQVRLEVLGPLQVTGKTLTPIRGRKRQELLVLLLEARISGRSEVSRLTLLDTLYPDADELKASSSLKNLVHSLRETLGENAITTTNNGYALGACSSDAELFLQTGDTTLWRSVYLENLDTFDDSTVRDSLYLSLLEKTKALLATNCNEAARAGSILTAAEPYDTAYLKTYLTALRLSNNHGKLSRHYKAARERLHEVGEKLPETWQGFLT
jgi:hypothetical protein